jgi:hypothetical protein
MVKYLLSFLAIIVFIIEHSTVSSGGKTMILFIFALFLIVISLVAFEQYLESNC